MKFTKNIGMVLLAVYLIIDGLLGFGLNLGPFVFLYTLWHSPLESLFSSAGRSATLIWHPTRLALDLADLLLQQFLHLRRQLRADACFFMFEINENFEPL